jgi:hypothetical protein
VEGMKICQIAGRSIRASITSRERESLEARCVESLLVLYYSLCVCVSMLSRIEAKRQSPCL